MSFVNIISSQHVNIRFKLAGTGKRLLAWLIDLFIRILYFIGCTYLFTGRNSDDTIRLLFSIAVFLPFCFYFLLSEIFMNGQSIGKKIMRIKVISIDGYKPDFSQYINRWVFRLLDTGMITVIVFGMFTNAWLYASIFLIANIVSMVVVFTTTANQRIGDLVSGTTVIDLKSSTELTDTIYTEVEEKNYQVIYPQVIKLSDRDMSIIKHALTNASKTNDYQYLNNLSIKVKSVLGIRNDDEGHIFLYQVIRDYTYLTTK